MQEPLNLSKGLENIKGLGKKLITSENRVKILEKHRQYWEIILPFYQKEKMLNGPTHKHAEKSKNQHGTCN